MTDTIAVVAIEKFDVETVYDAVEGHDVSVRPMRFDSVPASEADLVEAAAGADALVLTRQPVTESLLEALPDLTVVGKVAIGFDDVDLSAAAASDTTVVHAPTYCVEEVSTHAVALLLSAVRRLRSYDAAIRDGEWAWQTGRPVHRLSGQTLGLVGFGSIGSRVAEKAAGFDLDLAAYDPYVDVAATSDGTVREVSFEALLAESDLVSVHAPLTGETEGMFDAAAFDAMSEGAVFVNTARGPIVDDEALAAALSSGRVAAAGLDVMPTEPPVDSPLLDREDVVLTPHAAWYSERSRETCIHSTIEDVLRVLDGAGPEAEVSEDRPWL